MCFSYLLGLLCIILFIAPRLLQLLLVIELYPRKSPTLVSMLQLSGWLHFSCEWFPSSPCTILSGENLTPLWSLILCAWLNHRDQNYKTTMTTWWHIHWLFFPRPKIDLCSPLWLSAFIFLRTCASMPKYYLKSIYQYLNLTRSLLQDPKCDVRLKFMTVMTTQTGYTWASVHVVGWIFICSSTLNCNEKSSSSKYYNINPVAAKDIITDSTTTVQI
jgi:hypothetical protein